MSKLWGVVIPPHWTALTIIIVVVAWMAGLYAAAYYNGQQAAQADQQQTTIQELTDVTEHVAQAAQHDRLIDALPDDDVAERLQSNGWYRDEAPATLEHTCPSPLVLP